MDNLMGFAKQAFNEYQQSQSGNQQQQYQRQGGGNPYEGGGDSNGGGQGGFGGGQNEYGQQSDFTGGRMHAGQGGGDFGIQGGSQFNSSDNRPPGQSGVGGFINQFLNQDQAVQHASNQSKEDSGMFSSAMSFLQNQNSDPNDLDEQGLQQAHQQAYGHGDSSNMGADSLGAAAALNALKKFTSGQGGQQSGGGGNFQSQLIGQAMSEAAQLFNQNGGAAGGGKQDAVNSAAQTMMKLLVKNQVSGMVGGGSEGGMGQLFSLAQKFM